MDVCFAVLFLMCVIYALFFRFLPYSLRESKAAKITTQTKKTRVIRYLFHSMLYPTFTKSNGIIAVIRTL